MKKEPWPARRHTTTTLSGDVSMAHLDKTFVGKREGKGKPGENQGKIFVVERREANRKTSSCSRHGVRGNTIEEGESRTYNEIR